MGDRWTVNSGAGRYMPLLRKTDSEESSVQNRVTRREETLLTATPLDPMEKLPKGPQPPEPKFNGQDSLMVFRIRRVRESGQN